MIRVTIAAGSGIGDEDDYFWVNPGTVSVVGPTSTPGEYFIVIEGQPSNRDIHMKEPTAEEFARRVDNYITTRSLRERELTLERRRGDRSSQVSPGRRT